MLSSFFNKNNPKAIISFWLEWKDGGALPVMKGEEITSLTS
jgi:hypothetical protein